MEVVLAVKVRGFDVCGVNPHLFVCLLCLCLSAPGTRKGGAGGRSGDPSRSISARWPVLCPLPCRSLGDEEFEASVWMAQLWKNHCREREERGRSGPPVDHDRSPRPSVSRHLCVCVRWPCCSTMVCNASTAVSFFQLSASAVLQRISMHWRVVHYGF